LIKEFGREQWILRKSKDLGMITQEFDKNQTLVEDGTDQEVETQMNDETDHEVEVVTEEIKRDEVEVLTPQVRQLRPPVCLFQNVMIVWGNFRQQYRAG
jgi:hypothetical protein